MNPIFQDVLVVDDAPTMRTLLSHILETAGFRVRTAADGAEALKLVQQECPYYVITDWQMSPVDGIEFCRRLPRHNLPHYVYVVLLTARSQGDDIVVGLNAGADDFIAKPVNKGELLARLQAGSRVLELEGRLSQLARCDSLTGVLNRRTFHEIFDREWSRAVRYGHPLSCAMIDVDFFKQINDTYGHSVGDSTLTALARTIERNCRRSDYLCRWGGDEFCALLPETDEQGALIWAERCRQRLLETDVCVGSQRLPIRASFGVAQRHEDMLAHQQLLDLADHALLEAKRAGRQCVMPASGQCLC
jgi:two-component system, cell cycle response regulator